MSLLKGYQINKIISSLSKKYDLSNLIEFTVEVNPGEATIEDLKLYKQFGINRLSIGVQSFQPNLLKFLSRNHGKKEIFETYKPLGQSGMKISI